jgi:hypothetical protein
MCADTDAARCLSLVSTQCADAQLAFKEAEAEWQAMLHGLRHDKAAAQAQLRRALVRGSNCLAHSQAGCVCAR